MKKVLKRFGKYLLLDRLAQGGMAEIFRAWAPSVDGGGRLMVLKCVLAGFGEDPEFIQMFRSEIRVTMGLNHPNIVQLYDFGEYDGRPFIAMELVDGKNLKQFTNRVLQKGQLVSPEFAAHIISLTAAGLHYAHAFKDRTTGASLNLVHRDISPQNLLLSYNGNIKIIDFGIAKVSTNSQATRAGIIKGKPSYLSPEQIEGLPLDGRSDIFSLGAVLWETLTGKKLFSGETDLAAVRMIEDCDKSVTPASTINKKVPPELDAIVSKALTKDREKRYKTAEEMQRALHRFIYAYKPDFDPSDFSNFIQHLFKAEMEQEQRAIQELNIEAKELFQDVEKAPTAEFTKKPKGVKEKAANFTLVSLEPVQLEIEGPHDRPGQVARPSVMGSPEVQTKKKAGSGKLYLFLGLIAAAIYLGPKFLGTSPENHPKAETAPAAVTQAPVSQQAPAPAGASLAEIKLSVFPEGGPYQVLLNQQAVNPASVKAPIGTVTKLGIIKQGFKTYEKNLSPTSSSPVDLKITLEPEVYGRLSLHSTPTSDARIQQGLLTWVEPTPITDLKLPPGEYQIELTNQMLGMKKSMSLTIQSGKFISQDVNLDVVK
jgi:serine/threonine protein kinase